MGSYYVKYLGDNVIQFPSGKKLRIMKGPYYDQIRVNYQSELLIDLRKTELKKKWVNAKSWGG